MQGKRMAAAMALAAVATTTGATAAHGQSGPAVGAPDAPTNVAFEYVTKLKRTGQADLVKRQASTVNVPTPLDVNGDSVPDLVGTLQALSTSQFTLRFERSPSAIGELPISAEAVIKDPSASLPRANIGVGYDARSSSAPGSWQTTAIVGNAAGGAAVDVTTAVTGAGSSVATVAGLFDGDAVTRTSPMGGSVNYAPVPASTSLGVTVGTDVEVRTGASSPTTATAEAQIAQGTRRRLMKATIANLPQQVSVKYSQTSADQRTVKYTATAAIPTLSASYTDTTGSALTAKAVVNAKSLPLGMTLTQETARRAKFTTTGGSLGSLEAGMANGEPALLTVANPYARVRQVGTLRSIAARIDDLSSATVDATDDLTAELQLGAGPRKPFRALVEVPGKTIDGTIANLPRHIKAVYSSSQSKVTYDAFGETIDRADVSLVSDTALFGRVKKISARIDKLPPSVVIGFKPAGTMNGVGFTATPAVGAVEASLTDGKATAPVIAAGESGVVLRDLPTEFAVTGRLLNVSSLRLIEGAGQLQASLKTAPLADGTLQSPTLDATFDTAGDAIAAPAHVVASLGAIPTDVTLEHGGDRTIYTANGLMSSVRLHADNLPGSSVAGKIHNVEAFLQRVPAQFSIEHGSLIQGVHTSSPEPFLRIDLEAWDQGPENPNMPASADMVNVNTRDGQLHAQMLVHGLSKFLMRKVGTATQVETSFGTQRPGLFVKLLGGTTADPITADASMSAPPLSSVLRYDTTRGLHLKWDASADIPQLSGHLNKNGLSVNVSMNLPKQTEVCFGGKDDCTPQSPQNVLVDDGVRKAVPNEVTAFTKASAPIKLGGFIDLPSKTVTLNHLQLQNARVEIAHGPLAAVEDILKVYVDTDRTGIGAAGSSIQGEVLLRKKNSSKFTNVFIKNGKPLRNHVDGQPFLTVWDTGGFPNRTPEPRRGQLDCDGLVIRYPVPNFVDQSGVIDLAPYLRDFNECA